MRVASFQPEHYRAVTGEGKNRARTLADARGTGADVLVEAEHGAQKYAAPGRILDLN